MTLKGFLEYMESADTIRIMDAEKKDPIYAGYLGMIQFEIGSQDFPEDCLDWEVKKLRIVPEIRDKKWKEKGLLPPLRRDQTPQYSFSDMQIDIYREIWIDSGSRKEREQ